ncbi:peptidase family M1-domain-containing protein [Hypoxylon trugodes]|uniref:peptidase family M1-domain-containing protein n=1 Tax=Hypoxylon trugodes TaxID=326681 RepID=UPI002190ABAE|nr:peptidase family M1-domain-containing protein [Hypoxylon trugodes]KAI1383293.1 peptidase family M1-domain-containing protein [Hypoxylon trugodes]
MHMSLRAASRIESIPRISTPIRIRLRPYSHSLSSTPTTSQWRRNHFRRSLLALSSPPSYGQPSLRFTNHSSLTSVSRSSPLGKARNNTTLLPRPLVRHCSYRRHNMCKLAGDIEHTGGAAPDPTQGRELLPTNVVPTHYDVTLEPDFKKFSFEGKVLIDFDVKEDSKSIALHTIEIQINSAIIRSGESVISSSSAITYDESKQISTIELKDPIPKGKAQLEIKFIGLLNDQMAGFYRSTYKKPDGSEGILATTQMEANDCRRAFPCFDEPMHKAKFTITLIADKHLTCLSNMDVASESDVISEFNGSAKKAVKFNTTPLMSTYLVAFIIGELNYIETKKFRVPIRVYAPASSDIEHGRFSLELAARTLEYYEKIFGAEFPLPKMDMVAIPDFAAGAMENWGLITYRVVDLMLDEKASGAAMKERVAEVVQHELAHQWFGNLVTMDWWEGLWLNEGFATLMSWLSCNHFYPEWKVWENYVTDNLQSALGLDSLRSSHPIEVPVKRASEVDQIFDAISYSKGSCVLRMISTYLGEETFLEGVRRYIKKHAYGNTQTDDLWAALEDASGKPVREIMSIWTKNVGYPVVQVTEDEKDSSIRVKQNRFLRTGDTKPEEDQVLYPVFLGLRSKDGVDDSLTLTKREDVFKVKDLDFFKLNANHTSIYRTSYTPERLTKLGLSAKQGLLTVEDRAGMIADAGALAVSGYQKTSGVLNLLKGFDTEESFVVWSEIIARVATVQSAWIFEDSTVRDGLEAFVKELVSERAHKLGWTFSDKDGHVEQQFKAMLFGAAGMAGDQKIIAASKEMFNKYMAGEKSAIHPNIRGSVFSMALKYGGKAEYDALLDFFHKSTNSDERNTALRCIGRAKGPALIKQTLDFVLSGEVKSQDLYLPASGLRSHAEGIEALFSWLTERWPDIQKRLSGNAPILGSMVTICTSSFAKAEQLQKVEEFFKDIDTKSFAQPLAQSKDAIRSKVAWLERDRDDVAAWVKGNGYGSKL